MKLDKAAFEKIFLGLQALALVAITIWTFTRLLQPLLALRPISVLESYVAGTLLRPYTYRALTILIIRGLMGLGMPLLAATYFQEYAFMVGFVLVFFVFCRELVDDPWFAFGASALVSPIISVTLYSKFLWEYDFNVIFMFMIGLLLLLRQQWLAYLVFFPIMCVAKETAILLTFLMAFIYWQKMPIKKLGLLLLIQGVLYAAIRLTIMWIFRNNPGVNLPISLRDHLDWAIRAPELGVIYFIVFFILLSMFYRWSQKPEFLRQASILLLPFVMLYILSGYPFEFRVFGEVFPVIYLLIIWPLHGLFGALRGAIEHGL